MQIGQYIPLDRQFSLVPKGQDDVEDEESLSYWGRTKYETWDELDNEYRSIILAEAGSGKTEELRQRANHLNEQGRPSFFIRIEDIAADFYNAFEIGNEAKFHDWLKSTEEAWFFLDSVDEARLDNPRDFERALRRFAKGISKSAHRAHIYISSRPTAWRVVEDRRLMDEILYFASFQSPHKNDEDSQSEPQSALKVYKMCPLDEKRVRLFCLAREAKNIDNLLLEIDRKNLWGMAERPFDLEGILVKWDDDRTLGSRLEVLRHIIDKRLCDDHNLDRAQRQSLNLGKARDGARRLASAIILTGQTNLRVPGSNQAGIDTEEVLADWNPPEVRNLLERGIFNDIIYGAVRFRNREVRELLAAEWFYSLLKSDNNRSPVEVLFFREQYGENIVTPRLRPILPWLIIFDPEVRRKALKIHPEIAVEEGDASQLPLNVRRNILIDIVNQTASGDGDRSGRDNNSIARIASTDLSLETERLINQYIDNDDAIFFLGRLVWQGGMSNCLSPLVDIVADEARGVYARIASARAVMTCGTLKQKQSLWKTINESEEKIPKRLLAEIVRNATPESLNIDCLLKSIGTLPPYDKYEVSDLDTAIQSFIESMPITNNQKSVSRFLDGLYSYLIRQPYVERHGCHVSEEYAWLLSPAIHLVEKLVEARNSAALEITALSIMLMVPALRFWRESDLSEHKDKLREYIPQWPELNDALYWASIEQARVFKAQKGGSLISDWPVSWLGHFWEFDETSLPRLYHYIRTRPLYDDKLVAISTAFRVYINNDKPEPMLKELQNTVSDSPDLQKYLNELLNPIISDEMLAYEEEQAEYKRERDIEKEKEKLARETWISELRANPDRISNSPNVKSGEFTKDQYWLMAEVKNLCPSKDRDIYSNWSMLIPTFGNSIAQAYRTAAVNHWQRYKPPLRSEGHQENNIPYSLIFAMAGLEIEANENPEFPKNLDELTACHALRYVTWELNGFPCWLERMHREFPGLVEEAITKELVWELENTEADKPMHYILQDIVHHAAWLHAPMALEILKWINANPTRVNSSRYYSLPILIKGGIESAKLAKLASQQIAQENDLNSISVWYALLVDCCPEKGIPKIENWLSSISKEESTHAAQVFITNLMGGSHVRMCGPFTGKFREPNHLKSLYVLMHQYIRVNEDNNRISGKVYSPELRDDAQDARNRLFNLLSDIPGKASYTAIKQLIKEHPDPSYRLWMTRHAYKKAEQDGDIEPWTEEQVNTFNTTQTLKPTTHCQLYEFALGRLYDLKSWLELGNDSPYKTWQRIEDETEMRNLIAGWLNQQRSDQYITAQEHELANSQRMDIWLQNDNVISPIPIELKLLDKNWSGPKLCERLRNQLVGDYLREKSASYGIMLLVWKGSHKEKKWKINNRLVCLTELACELKNYWKGISDQFNAVESIEVIVIDLSARGRICDS